MGAASHVLLINFTVLLLAGAGFAVAWAGDRSRRALAWIALGFALVIAGGVAGVATPLVPVPAITSFGLFTLTAWGVLALSLGVRLHYDQPVRPVLYASGAVAVVAATLVGVQMTGGVMERTLVLNAPAALATVPALFAVLRLRHRGPLDVLLSGSIALIAMQFVARGFLAAAFDAPGPSPFEGEGEGYALAVFTTQTLVSVLGSAALAMVHVRDTVRVLERASEHDPLTGLLNRRGLDAAADGVVNAKARSFRPASVVVADIDLFKSVNDTYGHDAGDRVIRALAALMVGTARDGDLVARMGGEEFVTVMGDASPEVARLYAEAVRVAMAEIEHGALNGERVTASFGVAELMPGDSLSEAVAAADMALYEAKRAGRNRVRLSRPQRAADWDGAERRTG